MGRDLPIRHGLAEDARVSSTSPHKLGSLSRSSNPSHHPAPPVPFALARPHSPLKTKTGPVPLAPQPLTAATPPSQGTRRKGDRSSFGRRTHFESHPLTDRSIFSLAILSELVLGLERLD
jgi:hypothetical protein